MAMGLHLSTDLAFALRFEGSSGSGLAWGYCMATPCEPSGQEHPAFKIWGSGRKEGDAAAPLPPPFFSLSLSLFITSLGIGNPSLEIGKEEGDFFKNQ